MIDPSDPRREQIDQLAESFVARFRAGERPGIEEYARNYPDLAEELRQLLPALVMLEQHGSLDDGLARGPRMTGRSCPREIGEFTIVREIGRGGMGIVYEAVQQSLGRHVALKVLSASGLLNPLHLERFRLEARSAARLHHSHIVPVFGVGEHDGLHYYAMQYIAGQSLDQVIEALRQLQGGPSSQHRALTKIVDATHDDSAELPGVASSAASPSATSPTTTHKDVTTRGQFTSSASGRPFQESVARLGFQVAEALAYAHNEGLLHRDIKPSNLLIDGKGNVWVTDFGLVKAEDNRTLTETGDFVGTLRYMAPERLDGWSDRRSDIYGLGVTLYELLTLRTFFEGAHRGQLLDSVRNRQPLPPTRIDPTIPRDLETIVMKALAKEPASRYHNAEEMAEDLRRFLADRPILARRSTPSERLWRWCRRNPVVATLLAAVAITLTAGTIVSTAQAVRATRAERLAEAERATAEANFQKAKAAVDEYFTSVSQTALFDVPGLESLRKDLLEGALRFYEGAALERTSDPAVLVDLAATYLRVSTAYQTLGQLDAWIAASQKALDAIQQLQLAHPDAVDYEEKLAGFWLDLRLSGLATQRAKDPAAAERTLLSLEKTWNGLADRHPQNVALRNDLAAIRMLSGWAMVGAGRRAEGTQLFQRGLDANAALIREFPEVTQYRSNRIAGLKEMIAFGRADDPVDPRLRELTREAVDLSESIVSDAPENPNNRYLLAWSLSELARSLENTDRVEAGDAYRRAVDLSRALFGEFPGHPLYQRFRKDLTVTWVRFLLDAQQDEQAAQATLEVVEAFEARLRNHPREREARDCLAALMSNIAHMRRVSERHPDLTERLFVRSLALYQDLATEFPREPVFRSQAAHCQKGIGELALAHGRPEEACKRFGASADLFGDLAADTRIPHRDGNYLAMRTYVLKCLAQAMEAAHRPKPAIEETYLAALAAGEACLAAFPNNSVCRDNWVDATVKWATFVTASDYFAGQKTVQGTIEALEQQLTGKPSDRMLRTRIAALSLRVGQHRLYQGNETAAAERPLLRAMELNDSLARDFPSEHMYRESYAWSCRALGDVCWRTGLLEKAQTQFETAARYFGELHAADPRSRGGWYLNWKSDTLVQLAQVLSDSGNLPAAISAARQAVEASQELATNYADEPRYRVRCASALRALSERLYRTGELAESKSYAAKALTVCDSLLDEPIKDISIRQDFGWALLAFVNMPGLEAGQRERLLRGSLAVQASLADTLPHEPAHREQTGHAHRELAWFEQSRGNSPEAIEHFQQAVEVFQKLAADQIPQRDGFYVAYAADSLAHLAETRGRRQPTEAVSAARQSVKLCEQLVASYPHNQEYSQKLSWTARVLAEQMIANGQIQEALDVCQQQIDFWKNANRPTENSQEPLARNYLSLALLYAKIELPDEAKRAWKQAVELGSLETQTLNEFAWGLVVRSEVEQGVAELAVAAAVEGMRKDPDDAMCLNTLGVAQYRAGQWKDAIASLTRAEELAPNRSLAFNAFFLAMAHAKLGHDHEAHSWHERARAWMTEHKSDDNELIGFRAEAEQLLSVQPPRESP